MPRIKTTPMARVALWALRIYLLILLSLIGLKFARVFSGSQRQEGLPTSAAPAQTNQPVAETKQ